MSKSFLFLFDSNQIKLLFIFFLENQPLNKINCLFFMLSFSHAGQKLFHCFKLHLSKASFSKSFGSEWILRGNHLQLNYGILTKQTSRVDIPRKMQTRISLISVVIIIHLATTSMSFKIEGFCHHGSPILTKQ